MKPASLINGSLFNALFLLIAFFSFDYAINIFMHTKENSTDSVISDS